MAKTQDGAPRKRFITGKFIIEILLGILIPVILLGVAKLYIARKVNSIEVTEPPREMRELVKACGVEGTSETARQADANEGGTTVSANGKTEEDFQSVKTYEDYLRRRVRRNPRDEAARLYLEFAELVQAESFQKEFEEIFQKGPGSDLRRILSDSPLTEDVTRWVHSHGREIALLKRLCQTSDSLALTPGEQATILKKMEYFDYSAHFYGGPEPCIAAIWLLTSDARLQLAQGRPEEARRDYLGLLALAEKAPRWTSFTYLHAFIENIQLWLKEPGVPATDWRAFIAPLDAYCRRRLTRDRMQSEFAAIYTGVRNYWAREQGWRRVFSERRAESQDEIPVYFYIGTIRIPDPRPRIDRALTEAFYEERVPHWLKRFDQQWQAILERARRPWPGAAGMEPETAATPSNLLESCSRFEAGWQQFHTMMEARANVLRAALRLMSGEGAGAAERSAEAVRKDPHSPWRDPFTEAPLRVVEQSTQTLIYSLGPDLTDQQGKVEYGQKSRDGEEFDAGDIILRIPNAGR